jgi:hypothetical protein
MWLLIALHSPSYVVTNLTSEVLRTVAWLAINFGMEERDAHITKAFNFEWKTEASNKRLHRHQNFVRVECVGFKGLTQVEYNYKLRGYKKINSVLEVGLQMNIWTLLSCPTYIAKRCVLFAVQLNLIFVYN